MKRIITILNLLILAVLVLCTSCAPAEPDPQQRLEQTAGVINEHLAKARDDVLGMRDKAMAVYAGLSCEGPDGRFDPARYRFFDGGVFYKYKDDGLGALWASGIRPKDPCLMRRIMALDTLAPLCKANVVRNQPVVQSFLADLNQVIVFYPFMDSASVFEPTMDVTQAIAPFYEVAPKRNPERRMKWLSPYLDMTGKGVIVTITAPIYTGDTFQGVSGSDVSVTGIGEVYLEDGRMQMLLTDGMLPLAISKACGERLQLKGIEKHYYLKVVTKDEYISEEHALHNGDEASRLLAQALGTGKAESFLELRGVRYHIFQARVPETGWRLVEFMEAKR
jgi:hypothetical protein